jgi:hypothetical protein
MSNTFERSLGISPECEGFQKGEAELQRALSRKTQLELSEHPRSDAPMKPSLRARIIAEWRGLPEKHFPKDNARQVSALLDKVMTDLGLGERLREEEVLAAWRSVVGDFIAQHSTPSRLVQGVLHVRVLQPAMLYELDRTMRPEIVRKLKQRFGRAVRDVKFRVG